MATRKKKREMPEKGLFGPIQKPPLVQEIAPVQNTSTAIAQQQQELIESLLSGRLTGEIKVSLDGTMKIRAQDAKGATMTLTGYINEHTGYQERGFSALPRKLSPVERREEVQRLAATGMTQQAIAERLGVSQKTVSNDIKKS